MKKWSVITIFAIVNFGFSSCYYDKAELIYKPNNTPCDTTTISYKNDIVPILSANCYSCHGGDASGASGLKLDVYDNVKMMSPAIVPAIQHDPGFSQMPKGGAKLSDCHIAKIRTWVRAGAPDN